MKSKSILLSFSLLASTVKGKSLVPKVGKCKPRSEASRSILLGKDSRHVMSCAQKCLFDESCVAMQFVEPRYCDLFYTQVQKIVEADDGSFCGRVSYNCADNDTYTFGSYEWVGSIKVRSCAWIADNKEKRQKWCGEIVDGTLVASECPDACSLCGPSKPDIVPGCTDSSTFTFGPDEYDCAWITANENRVTKRRNAWCDTDIDGSTVADSCPKACGLCLPAPTASPTASPTISPTDSPTVSPSTSPTASPTTSPTASPKATSTKHPTTSPKATSTKHPTASPIAPSPNAVAIDPTAECILEATLGFPFNNPDGASYYGYHADYLEVTMDGDNENQCSWYYSNILPDWCTYSNSDPKGDSAYVANVDDTYYDNNLEELWIETVVISGAAGKSYSFAVTHWFFDMDYYTTWENWEDHMLAAKLKIKNLSHASQTQLKKAGWSHPVQKDTPTHIKVNGKWVVNPEYQGKFVVSVSCNNNCWCQSEYNLVSSDP